MRCATTILAYSTVCVLGIASVGVAQNRGTGGFPAGGAQGFGGASAAGGTSGMFGARSLGSSLSGGNRGFAGGGGGNTGVNGGQGVAGRTQQLDTAGQLSTNDRFLRGNRQPGQFVGSDASDLPSFLTNLATGGGVLNNNLGGNNRGRGQNQNQGNANQNNAGRGRTQAVPYRTTRSVAFDYPRPSAGDLTATLSGLLQRSTLAMPQGPLQVEVRDRTAILRGVVATAHDRDLAERLALLEAGISRVQNELTVAQPPATLPQAPPVPQP